MTPADLASIAQDIFGPDWRNPLARLVNVNYRLVRRWQDGTIPIPDDVATILLALRERHQTRKHT